MQDLETIDLRKLADPEPLLSKLQIKIQTVSKTASSGLAVGYIDARDVAERLDAVAGPDNWSDSFLVVQSEQKNWVVECRLTVAGVTKTDVGEGDAAKDAYSDALKRAAVKFGLGRFLYDLPQVWADTNDRKDKFLNPESVRAKMIAGWRTSTQPATSTTPKGGIFGQSRPAPAPTQPPALPMESLGDLQAATDIELSRVGWGPGEGRSHIALLYGVGSRSGLTVPQYQEFLSHLRTLPSAQKVQG